MLLSSWIARVLRLPSRPSRRRRRASRRGTPLTFQPRLEMLEDRVVPSVLTVNSNADSTAASNSLTLREAILLVDNGGNAQAALGRNLTAGEQAQISGTFGTNDTIQFDAGLNGQTITLNGAELPAISQNVTIAGLGASNLAISGNNQNGVFAIRDAAQVRITGLTIEDGNSSGYGGGIYNSGKLTVSNSTLAGNSAYLGGGIYSGGTLTLTANTFKNCSAINGGAIFEQQGAVSLSQSTLSQNTASSGAGGGIYVNSGSLCVTASSLVDNSANQYDGGGVFIANGSAQIRNSTFYGNTALAGGGLWNYFASPLDIVNSTFVGNTSTIYAGGITSYGSATTLVNTIVANNGSADLSGNFTGSNDLIGDGSDLSSFSNSLQGNPQLAPLGYYGGPTQTMALLPGSAAIGAGDPSQSGSTDQRGFVHGSSADIGAFQTQTSPLQINSAADTATGAEPSGELSLRDAINLVNVLSPAGGATRLPLPSPPAIPATTLLRAHGPSRRLPLCRQSPPPSSSTAPPSQALPVHRSSP